MIIGDYGDNGGDDSNGHNDDCDDNNGHDNVGDDDGDNGGDDDSNGDNDSGDDNDGGGDNGCDGDAMIHPFLGLVLFEGILMLGGIPKQMELIALNTQHPLVALNKQPYNNGHNNRDMNHLQQVSVCRK